MPPRPRGPTSSKREIRERLALVEQLWLENTPMVQLLEECRKKRGMAARTTRRYIRAVQQQIAREQAAAEPHARARRLRQLEDLAGKLEAAGAWGPLVRLRLALAEASGLVGSQQPQVQVNVLQVSGIVSGLSAEELDHLERLATKAKHQQALPAAEVTSGD